MLGFIDARTLHAQRIQRDDQQHDAGGDLKRRRGDAKNLKDGGAGERKSHASTAAMVRQAIFADASPLLRRVIRSHRQKHRDNGPAGPQSQRVN